MEADKCVNRRVCELMMRPPKLIAVLLALILGVSGNVASLAACQHNSRHTITAHAPHACCHAAHAHHHAQDSTHDETREHAAHNAMGDHTTDARASVHHDADCAPGDERDAARAETINDSDAPCAGCCMARAAAQPRAVATTATQKSKRLDDARESRESHANAANLPLHTSVAPKQHAPPAPSARLHILIGVLLI
jgi:hypothetical protein